MKVISNIVNRMRGRYLRNIFLFLLIALQFIVIYLFAFVDWQGPGDFGGNYNYIPAVMIAAGKGFTDVEIASVGDIPALNNFIRFETMQLDPALLPEDMPIIEGNEFHRIYQYLLYTVGYLWKVFGISWNVVRILFVFVLLCCAMLVYGISRLMMPPLWSLLVAHAFVWNTAVLGTMYSFRDFSKAIFILSAVYILGTMIKKRPDQWRYIGGAVLIGAILGVGMGFRRDMQVIFPVSLVVLATCRLQGVRHAFFWRSAAVMLSVLVFTVLSSPILMPLYNSRWLNAHDTIMGFATLSDENIGLLEPASYEKHLLQTDVYTTYKVWTAYQHGFTVPLEKDGSVFFIESNSPALFYGYIFHSVSLFPADFLSRAYAAVLRSCIGVGESLLSFLRPFEIFGLITVGISLLSIAFFYPYTAWQMLLMLCLYCGCISLQYRDRHAFHTTFIPYLFGCFILYHLICIYRRGTIRTVHEERTFSWNRNARSLLRLGVWALVTGLAFWAPLRIAQVIQERQVRQLQAAYRNAASVPVEHVLVPGWEGGTLVRPFVRDISSLHRNDDMSQSGKVSVYAAHFDALAGPLDISLIYDSCDTSANFSVKTTNYSKCGVAPGKTTFYFPVYEIVHDGSWNMFSGLLMPDEQAAHFLGFDKLITIDDLGYFLNLTIPENEEAFIPAQNLIFPWPFTPRAHTLYKNSQLHLNQETNDLVLALEGGDLETAARLCREGLKRCPGRLQFMGALAQVHFLENRFVEGWEIIDAIIRDFGENAQVYRFLDEMCSSRDDAEARYGRWQRLHQEYPDSPSIRFYYEESLLALMEVVLEADDFSGYHQLMNGNLDFLPGALLGDAWLADNRQPEELSEFWRRISEGNPQSLLPYLRLGIALERQQKEGKAAAAYAAGYERYPENAENAIRYATCLQNGLEQTAAFEIIDAACVRVPDMRFLALERLAMRGNHLLGKEAFSSALAYYGKAVFYAEALQQHTYAMELKFRFPEIMAKQGYRDESIALLQDLLCQDAESINGTALAAVLVEEKQQCIFWRKMVECCPKAVLPWIHLGLALMNNDRKEEAKEAYCIALSNDLPAPRPITLLYYLSAPFISMDDAVRLDGITRILEAHPELLEAAFVNFYKSAEYCEKQGDFAQAALLYSHAIRCKPADPWLHFRAAQMYLRNNDVEDASRIMLALLQDDSEKPVELKTRLLLHLFLMGKAPGESSFDAYVKQHFPDTLIPVQQGLVEEAQKQLHQGNMESAENEARMAAALAPGTQSSWSVLGEILEKQGNIKVALDAYHQGVLSATDIDLIADRFNVLLTETTDIEERIRTWNVLLETRQDVSAPILYYVRALGESNRWPEVRQLSAEALSRFPDTPALALELAAAHIRLGALDQALPLIDHSITDNRTLRDRAIDILVQESNDLDNNNKDLESERFFEQLVLLEPDSAFFLLQWGQALEALGKKEAALSAFKKAALAGSGQDAAAAADHLDRLLEPQERKTVWETLLAALPYQDKGDFSDFPEDKIFIVMHYIKLLAEMDYVDDANTLLRKIQHIYPQNPLVMFAQGLLQCRMGNSEACALSFATLLAVHPEKRSVVLAEIEGIFETLFDEERYADSEKIARSLVMMEPENPLRYFQLGEALYGQQHYQAALEQFEQVLTVAPESPRSADRVDAIFEKLSQPDARIALWNRLLEIHPESSLVKVRLENAMNNEGQR